MNTDQEKLRALLDDVLPASGEHCGPSGAEVLSMLRNERQRRRRLRGGAALMAIISMTAGALLWNHEPTVVATVPQAPVEPASIVVRRVNDEEILASMKSRPGVEMIMIHRVNDEELFALLQGTPTALMELPNGDRRLLVIEQSSPP